MFLKNLLFGVILLSSSLILAQTHKITKIIDTNLFELDNNQKVKFYGLFIPSLKDSNNSISKLGKQIWQWENDRLLNKNFRFDFISKDTNGVSEVVIYKSYAFSEKNLALQMLFEGYASLLNDIDKKYYNQLIGSQKHAQKYRLGIWGNIEANNSLEGEILDPRINQYAFKKKVEQPYLSLLVISAASFVLAWDSFSDVSDIQITIDALRTISKNADVSKYESIQKRKYLVGVTCLVAGIVTTLFSLQEVEVKTDLQSLSIGYRF